VDLFVAEFIPSFLKMLPVYLSIAISVVFYFFYSGVFRTEKIVFLPLYAYESGSFVVKSFLKFFHNIYSFLIKKWYFDLIYNYFISFGTLNLSYTVFKKVDRGLFEYVGPTGIVNYLYGLKNFVANLQSGPIYVYLTHMVLGLSFLIYFYLFPVFTNYEDFFVAAVLLYCLISTLVSKVVSTTSMELAQTTKNNNINLKRNV
jgi:NADH:ubiquinone oxidoreductase subunit 5 (subunit L)/multisubunit Na+/H+ antiporter MnhA subunit